MDRRGFLKTSVLLMGGAALSFRTHAAETGKTAPVRRLEVFRPALAGVDAAERQLAALAEAGDGATASLLILRSSPGLSIGALQRAEDALDLEAAAGHAVHRRHFGGGTAYLDEGQVLLALLLPGEHAGDQLIPKVGTALTDVLRDFGLPACFGTRNDVLLDGAKISGIGSAHRSGHTAVYATLLLRTDLEKMRAICRPALSKAMIRVHFPEGQTVAIAEPHPFLPASAGCGNLHAHPQAKDLDEERLLAALPGTLARLLRIEEVVTGETSGLPEPIAQPSNLPDVDAADSRLASFPPERLRRGVVVSPAGLLQVDVALNEKQNAIEEAVFTGDILPDRPGTIGEIRSALSGAPVSKAPQVAFDAAVASHLSFRLGSPRLFEAVVATAVGTTG